MDAAEEGGRNSRTRATRYGSPSRKDQGADTKTWSVARGEGEQGEAERCVGAK